MLCFEQKSQTFEAEKSEAGDLKKLVEECTEELRSKRNLLTVRLDSLTRVQRELESKDNQLGQVMAEIKRRCTEARNVQERKREVEDETASKKKELSLIVEQIEESDKQLENKSREVELKEKDIEENRKELDLVKSQVKAWERKLIQLRKLVDDDCTRELSPRKDHVDSSNNTHVLLRQSKLLCHHLMLVPSMSPKHPPLFYTHQRKETLKDPEETEEKLRLKGDITN
ncbi:hypothetical protein ARALYDRAFT_340662 [Arabidopsis lyrata subsp. lyrata]|uniref:Uncharacterized protein n=1 Tax=Arabidopsis lyrata subsp. lyrata TaxID=81972 RepID=D7L314_ARALL|nr:hypothetical protein ARALYDRAFT_340662 [Arabidopsis lyrata subsp. lyrata]